MYKLFLCLRYLRKRRIAFFAIGAVCLCVAMVLIVVSVMGGFLDLVKQRSRGLLGDLVMENGTLQGFPFYQEFIDELCTEMPDRVKKATPVIISYGVLRFPSTKVTKPVQVVGLRLQETYEVNAFKQSLFYEKYYPGRTTLGPQRMPRYGLGAQERVVLPPELQKLHDDWRATASEKGKAEAEAAATPESMYDGPGRFFPVAMGTDPGWSGDELPGIIIGTDLCAKRESTARYTRIYALGEQVELTLVPVTPAGRLVTGTGAPTKVFRYADDSRTGVYDIDSLSVYIDFDVASEVLEMGPQEIPEEFGGGMTPARATQIQIKLQPGVDPLETLELIDRRWAKFRDAHMEQADEPQLLNYVQILTWEQKQRPFIAAVEKEKILVTILFGVISVVAVFLVGCIFYMIVQEKTRDIGIVKSVGATSRGVASIFLTYGAAVGVVGGILGTLLGAMFVFYINDIQDVLAKINPELRVWDPSVYTFDRIPNQVKPQDVAVIFAIATIASMVGSVMAAVRAGRVWPVEALRYE